MKNYAPIVHIYFACSKIILENDGTGPTAGIHGLASQITFSQFGHSFAVCNPSILSLVVCQVLYLRSLESLGSLGLAGNPVSDSPEYQSYIGAFLPQLTYLDYRLVQDRWRQQGLRTHRSGQDRRA